MKDKSTLNTTSTITANISQHEHESNEKKYLLLKDFLYKKDDLDLSHD